MDITKFAILKKLAGGGGTSTAVEIDNKTIVKGSDGKLKTSVGGYETVDFDITWDGDTTGKTFVEIQSQRFYHVSDEFVTKEQLIGATVEKTQGSEKVSVTIAEGDVQEFDGVVSTQVGIISVPAPTTISGITFEKKGVYFSIAENNNFISRLFAVTVEKIPAKFIDKTLLEQEVDDVRAAANAAQTTANAAQTTANEAVPKSGGTMTAPLAVSEGGYTVRVGESVYASKAFAINYVNQNGGEERKSYLSSNEICIGSSSSGFYANDQNIFVGKKADNQYVDIDTQSGGRGTKIALHNVEYGTDKYLVLYHDGVMDITGNTLTIYGDKSSGGSALILHSSTENSSKNFKITVNDAGTLSATEVT